MCYANLDPVGIPSSDAIEAMYAEGTCSKTLFAALYSLQVIASMLKLPDGVYPELWQRVWRFTDFFHTYHEHLLGLPSKRAIYAIFAELFARFHAFGHGKLISSTVGIHGVVVMGWSLFLDDTVGQDHDSLRNTSFWINWDLINGETSGVEKYLDAAGGIDILASMVTRHLARAADHDIISGTRNWHCTAAIGIIADAKKSGRIGILFDAELRSQGIIKSLVAAACSLNLYAATHENSLGLLTMAIHILGKYSTHPPGRVWMSEALQAGMLGAILLLASTHPGDSMLTGQVVYFITSALPGYLVYRSILIHLRTCLMDVEELVNTEAFAACPAFASWQQFRDAARDRLNFLEVFDSTPPVLYKACDNVVCGEIRLKSELQRCSTCLDVYYCSRECQAMDWRAAHRTDCQTFSGIRNLPGALI
ncbi:hypothetical protein B0H15DRAFT_833178 [Mycena belliarum]|uniref:MYND-type domain-containing protein n=1 Tax=Mycena belliarum TaxID=1033014 RepID=A0AAD6XR14_9AGAR|nr:hypothetical protein B0H15DRAFT_833178 [Mycena belliae]